MEIIFKITNKAQLQLIYKLSRSYIFYHYRIIFRELDSVETCRSVVIYKLIVIVLSLVISQNNKNMHGTCIKMTEN